MWGVLFAFALCLPLRAGAQTINAATCSSTDVQNALNSVKADGTVVNIPSGTCTWTSTVSYNQVYSTTVQGQTTCTGTGTQTPSCADNTVISGPEYSFAIITAPGKLLRISGFTFQLSASSFNGLLHVTGSTTQLRIDHNHFFHMQAVAVIDGPLGVADHNFFDFSTTQSVFNGLRLKQSAWNGFNWGDGSWADSSYFGSSKFLFFEDNTATRGFINDCDTGARFVMRHNYFNNATMQAHEMQGRWNGCRAYEIYSNTMFSDGSAQNDTADAVLLRTGTGLLWGNTVTSYGDFVKINNDRSNTSHGFSPANFSGCVAAAGSFSCWGYACNNSSQLLGTDCTTATSLPNSPSGFDGNTDIYGYPALEQVGRGKGNLFPQFDFTSSSFWTTEPAWPKNQLEPLYLWNNTLIGTAFLGSIFGSHLFQENRDYYSNNGTSIGIGTGTSLPGNCTPLQAFWNTNTNTLYQCSATNTWTAYYTPYTYPHPLTAGSGTPPAPPTGLQAIVN